ncbi:MAG TPA: hypothetical protein VJB39_02070 [Patescibacteria group bacterium]|nr:hypothetical protein [Patescibacteria group bacterium]
MYNWSIDLKQLKKDKEAYAIWRLEQMVNFGLGGKKINKNQLKKYWLSLNLDPVKKKYLEFLLWPKRY